MKKYEYQRGAILVESALVVGAIFLMLFGTVFLSIIGFDQMSADGASYEVAHQTSVGASASPAQAAHNTFPNIPQANITTTVQPAPDSSISVDYGYNDPDKYISGNSVNQRHGGVSVMQGTSVSGAANKQSAAILGMPIKVLGSMIEPMWLENGLHFDAQNSNDYGSSSGQTICSTPPTPSGTATPQPARCFQGNVFSQGENAPQYYTSVNVLADCGGRNLPWGTGVAQLAVDTPNYCEDSQMSFIPMGVAEFLDLTNWCPTSGASGNCTVSPATSGISGSKQSDSTFANIACHQRVYQVIANYFQNNTNLQKIYERDGATNGSNPTVGFYTSPGPAFYYARPLLENGKASNTFATFAGYDTPLSSQNPTDATASVSGTVDNAVREVYNWDGNPLQNPPVADPLTPDQGC